MTRLCAKLGSLHAGAVLTPPKVHTCNLLITIISDVIYEFSLSKSCQETLSQVFTIESLSEIPVLEEFFCNPLDINFEYFTGDFEKIAKRKEFRHGRTLWLWPRTEILKPIMKSKGLNIEGDDYSSNFRGYK